MSLKAVPAPPEPHFKLAFTLEVAELDEDGMPKRIAPGKAILLMRWQAVTDGPIGMMHTDFQGFVAFVVEKLTQNACAAIPGLKIELMQQEGGLVVPGSGTTQ